MSNSILRFIDKLQTETHVKENSLCIDPIVARFVNSFAAKFQTTLVACFLYFNKLSFICKVED